MALSGHKEYDFFKAEKRFIDNNFQTPEIRKEMRKHLYKGYRSVKSLDKDWEERQKFYRYINIIEGLRVFHQYQSELTEEERKGIQNFHKNYIRDEIGSKEDYLYQ